MVQSPEQQNPRPPDRQRIKLTVPSRRRNVGAVVRFVDELLLSMDLAKKTVFQVTLALDEALTNIVRHAYEGDETKEIIVTCELGPEEVLIRLRDFGQQVPLSQIRSRDLDEPRPGGLGVHLMRELMDRVEYNRSFDVGTELTLAKQIGKEDRYWDEALWNAVFPSEPEEDAHFPLTDEMTGLPTIRGIAARARELYLRDGSLGVLLFDAKRFPERDELYPYEVLVPILSRSAKAFGALRGGVLLPEDLVATNRPVYDDFMVLLSAGARGGELPLSAVDETAKAIVSSVVRSTLDTVDERVISRFGMRYGGAVIGGAAADPQQPLYEGIKQAGRALARRRSQAKASLFVALCEGLKAQEVTTLFQPIVSASDHRVHGYEAFSLLATGESSVMPQVLFDAALEANLSWQLDRLCIDGALKRYAAAPADAKLFLNIEADSLADPGCAASGFVASNGVRPDRLVLEFGARSIPRNWETFRSGISALSRQGVAFCLSNVSSDLTALAFAERVRPAYVKFDPILVRDCAGDSLKLALLRSLLKRCRELGCALIAMGVESEEDLQAVLDLGVDYVQGYYLAQPSHGFAQPQAVPPALIPPADNGE